MKNLKPTLVAALVAVAFAGQAFAQAPAQKPATQATTRANQAVAQAMAMDDKTDFEEANRGFIAKLPDPIVKDAKGQTVWDADRFAFMKGDAPATVNPSLWRQEKLNNFNGLYKVTDGIYQIRGLDLANMTLVEGTTGWIVIDPIFTAEMAKSTLAFALEKLGSKKPVVAVIYTHSHADHFGGVRGVVNEEDIKAGKVKIIAPDEFMTHSIAENVLAGNAMTRRSTYQFGIGLDANDRQAVGGGLGKSVSYGTTGLIPPTDTITKTGQEMTIDGVRIIFQMAQNSEAPSEMMFYFPDKKALCTAEVMSKTMHNIYTIRGAKIRDSLAWSKYINSALDMYPDAEVAFGSHHWPTFGKDNIRKYISNQRDTYRFLHDYAVHLVNKGETFDEIGDAKFFPKGLAADSGTHGYYGTLSHNLRGVVQSYIGFYDANPSTLNRLPPVDLGKRYVAAMGGEKAALKVAQKAFNDGDYRWAAEVTNRIIFANPNNAAAKSLGADSLEQLGYQAEGGTWRNAYLVGARELREGTIKPPTNTQSPDVVRGMDNELLFDFIALRLDHTKTDGMKANIQMEFTDSKESWALELSNSVLNNTKGRVLKNPDVKLTLTRPAFLAMLLQGKKLPELVEAKMVTVDGNPKVLADVFANVQTFDKFFNVVTP